MCIHRIEKETGISSSGTCSFFEFFYFLFERGTLRLAMTRLHFYICTHLFFRSLYAALRGELIEIKKNETRYTLFHFLDSLWVIAHDKKIPNRNFMKTLFKIITLKVKPFYIIITKLKIFAGSKYNTRQFFDS